MNDFPAREARAVLARAARRSVRLPDVEIALLDWAYSTVRCLRIAVEGYPH